MKLMAEEAVREKNMDDMLAVARLVIEQAMDGDHQSQKLVWNSLMSGGSIDDRSQGQEKVTIQINAAEAPKDITPHVEEAEEENA